MLVMLAQKWNLHLNTNCIVDAYYLCSFSENEQQIYKKLLAHKRKAPLKHFSHKIFITE